MVGAAISQAMNAYGYAEAGSVTAGYLIVVEQRIWRGGPGDGEAGMSALCMLYSDGDMPWVQILGLLRAATLRAESGFATEYDGEA